MNRRLSLLLLLALCSLHVLPQTTAIKSIYRTIKDTYETKADTMTNAFIESFMIKSKGIFNVSYGNYAFNAYWTQAHAIDVVVYAYERYKNIDRTKANKYLTYIRAWYNNKANNYAGAALGSGYKMFENPYTDDMCWITLTLLHMYKATGTTTYRNTARSVFDNYIITRATEDTETGGLKLPWHTNGGGEGPNACTQSPATLIAAKLYQLYGDAKYLEYAKKLYAFTSKKIVFSDGRVEDPPLSYTQGTFAEACRILYHVTDESATQKNKYRSLTYTYLNYAFTSGRCTSGNNILRDEGNSGDQSIFKAILIPYAVNYVLDEDMPSSNRLNLSKYILKNTSKMWGNLNFDDYPLVFVHFDWTKPWNEDLDKSMGAACSGASLVENSARMCRAIIDRYDLGTLYSECEALAIEPGHSQDEALSPFNSAMSTAKQILDSPDDYAPYQFADAIEKLRTAYVGAKDYATGIKEIQNEESRMMNDDAAIYNLAGQKAAKGNLPKGIYITGGRKILR